MKYAITKSTGQYEKDELHFAIDDTLSDAEIVALIDRMHRLMDDARSQRQGEQPPATVQMRDPDAPASEKQRSYMDYLLKELNWPHERLAQFAAERSLNVLTLTKREASELIDELKQLHTGQTERSNANAARMDARDDERDGGRVPLTKTPDFDNSAAPLSVSDNEPGLFDEPVVNGRPEIPIGERATQRQIRAIERLAAERDIDVPQALRVIGVQRLDQLSMDAAGQLLSEWQQRPRTIVRR